MLRNIYKQCVYPFDLILGLDDLSSQGRQPAGSSELMAEEVVCCHFQLRGRTTQGLAVCAVSRFGIPDSRKFSNYSIHWESALTGRGRNNGGNLMEVSSSRKVQIPLLVSRARQDGCFGYRRPGRLIAIGLVRKNVTN